MGDTGKDMQCDCCISFNQYHMKEILHPCIVNIESCLYCISIDCTQTSNFLYINKNDLLAVKMRVCV